TSARGTAFGWSNHSKVDSARVGFSRPKLNTSHRGQRQIRSVEDLFAKVSNLIQITSPRECYNNYGELENEKPVGVTAASREPQMEIPAKGILGGQQHEGRRKGAF